MSMYSENSYTSPTPQNTDNPYPTSPDNGGYPYPQPAQEKPDRQSFGLISLFCGIAALTFFCACINIPLAAVSIGFGSVQIAKFKRKGPAIAGIVMSCLSFFLMLIAIFAFATLDLQMDIKMDPNNPGGYEQYFEQYFENIEELEDESL